MKAICVLLCIILSILAKPILQPDEKAFLKAVHVACQADKSTFCDEDILRKLHENLNHPQAGIHSLCMSKKAGLHKTNNDLDLDVIKTKLALVTTDADEVTEKCAVLKETPEKTAAYLWVCFVQNNAPYIHNLDE